jgi:transcriptional regulator with XRE-family HTH domain
MKLGDYLRACRKKKGLSQEEIGKLIFKEEGIQREIGYAQKFISRLEAGIIVPELRYIKKIARAFNADMSTIISLTTGEEDKSFEVSVQNIAEIIIGIAKAQPTNFSTQDLKEVIKFREGLNVNVSVEIIEAYVRSFLQKREDKS